MPLPLHFVRFQILVLEADVQTKTVDLMRVPAGLQVWVTAFSRLCREAEMQMHCKTVQRLFRGNELRARTTYKADLFQGQGEMCKWRWPWNVTG